MTNDETRRRINDEDGIVLSFRNSKPPSRLGLRDREHPARLALQMDQSN
jgi:hypothetical protein